MSLNWDNIKYLFQVPLEWFKKINDRVFRAYGTNFIQVKTDSDGAMHIDVDEDAFNQAVAASGAGGGGSVTSVDGHAPDANGAVSFGLAASKWVKTDAGGHLTTTNDAPITVSSSYTPQNVTKNVVTKVEWTGTVLRYSSESWRFVNGVLVSVTANSNTTVDTPTVITWS